MATTQYIGARYVPIFVGEWDNTRTYEPLMVVTYQGASYTSRQYVPAGIEITNESYWVLSANYNAQVEAYRKEVRDILPYDETPTEGSTKGVTSDGIKKAISNETTRATEVETNIINSINELKNIGKSIVYLDKYGISTDESIDNSDTIQNAINEHPNEVLVLPTGIYGVKKTIDISNNASLICIGSFKAEATFTGDFVITINDKFSNPTVLNMTSYNKYIINVDCNNITGLSGVGVEHCYRCEFCINVNNTTACGLVNGPKKYSGNAENIFYSTTFNNDAINGSIGVKVNQPDSIFYVFTREVETGLYANARCDVIYAHCWLYTNTLWNSSAVFYNANVINAGTVECDTMRYVVTTKKSSVFNANIVDIIINNNIVSETLVNNNNYKIQNGEYAYVNITTFNDYYSNYINDSRYIDGNTVNISNSYNIVEYQGDMLKIPGGNFFINGTANITNAPNIGTGTWCLVKVTRSKNYNFILAIEQNTGKVHMRSSASSDNWKTITFS